MAENEEPIIHTCNACGALIDVSDEEPLALVHCPSCGTGARVRTHFHHFQVQEIMGAGGMGTVYRAFDTSLNRFVALKLLRKEFCADPEFVTQFKREASITASINHPHVVKVYSASEDHGHVYIAMELVDKGSLDDLMSLQGKIAEAQVLEVGSQIAQGLAAALGRGLIHRDIKPGNILFAGAHEAKIVDFGLAVLQEHAGTVAGEVWGTPYYVAPEKLELNPVEDFRSDMYSLGATLFHAVAGRPPFEAETASMVALKHLKSQVVSLQAFAPEVSSATAFVINKTLAKDPADRYQSYQELVEHLNYAREELQKTGGVVQKRARVQMDDADDARAMSWITFGMIGAVVAVGGFGAWMMRDKLFSHPDQKADPKTEIRAAQDAGLMAEFNVQREKLVKRQFSEAEEAFGKFGARPDVSQPLLSWAHLHQGLALLLDGKEEESRKVFGRLSATDIFGKEAHERKQAQFFIDLGKAMESAKPQPASVAKDYDKSNYEAIALLLFGLKDWYLGAYEDAGPLFRQFQSATPTGAEQWIAEYKELTRGYVEDFTVFRSAYESVDSARTPKTKYEALDKLKTARKQLTLPGELPGRIDKMLTELQADLAEYEEVQKQKLSESEEKEGPVFEEAKKKSAPYIPYFRFAEGKAIAEAPKLKSKKYVELQKGLVEKFTVLQEFKTQLIDDMKNGHPGPIIRRSGVPITATGKYFATDTQLEIRSQYGKVPILWAEATPDSIIAIARSYIKQDLSPEAIATRQWRLGIAAIALGKADVGKELVNSAILADPEYEEVKTRILGGE